jgi:RND superfamily putative drug exporter
MVLVLAPAMLVVMGRGTWWLPRWLARIVPEVDIEGRSLTRERVSETPPAPPEPPAPPPPAPPGPPAAAGPSGPQPPPAD